MHVWNKLTKGEHDRMEVEYLKGYRMATGHKAANNQKQHITNIKIQALANRPSFSTLQRVHRLRYLARLLLHGPTILLRLLDANAHVDDSWAAKINGDLEWLFDHTDPDHRPGQQPTVAHVRDAICSDPQRFRAQVRTALHRSLRLQADQAHFEE